MEHTINQSLRSTKAVQGVMGAYNIYFDSKSVFCSGTMRMTFPVSVIRAPIALLVDTVSHLLVIHLQPLSLFPPPLLIFFVSEPW